MPNPGPLKPWRQGVYAAKPGKYAPVARVSTPLVDPGESVHVQVYITGYGNIEAAKLHFAPPPGLLNEQSSRVRYDLKQDGPLTIFGGNSMILDPAGCTLSLMGGIVDPSRSAPTMFFDAVAVQSNREVPPISSEQIIRGHGIVDYELVVNEKARPGAYPLFLSFTYFDGNEWQNAQHTFSLTVRNFYQRNEARIAVAAVIAAVSTVVQTLYAIVAFHK